MHIHYIAFLRAINVGGHTVKMERLRELFTELGLEDVRTYIQSGNVFFKTDKTDRGALAKKIEAHLYKALGYEVPTMLCTVEEVERIVALDPFKNVDITPDTRLFVMFLAGPPPDGLSLPIVSPRGDFEIVAFLPGAAFVVHRMLDGRPGNSAAFIEKTLGVKGTARFFATTAKILEAAKQAS